MLRSTSSPTMVLTMAAIAGLTLSAATAYAQTKSATPACGVETWSTDKMTYVTPPCSAGITDESPGPARR